MSGAADDTRRNRFASIGELAGGARAKMTRSGQPVRRQSYHTTDRRSHVWRPIAADNREARRLIAARLKAAEFYDRRGKEVGKKNGPLGHVGLEVLRELYRIVDFKSGRLEPAIATVCEALKRSRAAVVDAMRRLKEHGFLNWVRRTEPTDNDGAGPQVRQITNAYFFDLPRHAAAWVKKVCNPGPVPIDEQERHARNQADVDAMLAEASSDEVVDFHVADPQLAEILKRVGASLSKNSASSLNGQNPASDE